MVLAALWVIFSDRALDAMVKDPETALVLQTYKGLLFVFVTGLLLFLILHFEWRGLRSSEDSLRVREERYRAFMVNSTEGIWRVEIEPPCDTKWPKETQMQHVWDHAVVRECNDMLARLYGLSSADQMIGRKVGDMVDRRDPDSRRVMERFVDDGYKVSDAQRRGFDAHGNVHYFANSMFGVVIDGFLVRAWGTHRDITKRRLTEIARRRLTTILDTATDFIGSCTPSGEISYLNRAARRMLGIDEGADLTGVTYERCHPPSQGEHLREAIEVARKRGFWSGETLFLRHDGELVPMSQVIIAHGGPDGEVDYFSTIARDITAAKATKDALEKQSAAAEAASAAKDRFLAMLSHELRTPLTPILMAVNSMERQLEVHPAVEEQLEMIRRNVELEARLIDDLLDLTRIGEGKLSLDLRPVDLHGSIMEVHHGYRRSIAARRLLVMLQLEADIEMVVADSVRLHQILWNLLGNAIKFTPEGGAITIKTSNPDNGHAAVTVTDNGIGIDPAMLARIFEPFEQGEPSVLRRFGGMGLGLAISRGMAEAQSGSLTVSSDGVGKGASFQLVLEVAPIAPAPRIEREAEVPAPLGGRMRILVVEDHDDTRRALSRLLIRQGYEVVESRDCARARAALQSQKFDVIVSDIGLPDGTGVDLMGEIRDGNTKGIALSGFGADSDIRRSLDAGFAHHLVKPVDFAEIQSLLREMTPPEKQL